MKSLKSPICASFLTLILASSSFAGNIGGMRTTSAGNIGGMRTNRVGNIGGLKANSTGNIGGLRTNVISVSNELEIDNSVRLIGNLFSILFLLF
jgi:hypothetical protein